MVQDTRKLLLIEDDDDIRDLLSTLLSNEGFSVDSASNGREGEHKALSGQYELIVLDIMLPEKDGLSILRDIRHKISCPILMLTAKGEALDRILGLEIGADDYLPKPFEPRELTARIKALLRRVQIDKGDQQNDLDDIQLANIQLKPSRREVLLDSRPLELTSTEFDILFHLMKSHNKIMSKAELTEKALKRKLTLYDRAIDMHVSNLRKKLPEGYIKTIRGTGYMLDVESAHE